MIIIRIVFCDFDDGVCWFSCWWYLVTCSLRQGWCCLCLTCSRTCLMWQSDIVVCSSGKYLLITGSEWTFCVFCMLQLLVCTSLSVSNKWVHSQIRKPEVKCVFLLAYWLVVCNICYFHLWWAAKGTKKCSIFGDVRWSQQPNSCELELFLISLENTWWRWPCCS